MTHYSSTALFDLPSIGNLRVSQGGASRDAQHPRSPRTLIHILDSGSLLNIFSLCRPVILDESETNNTQILSGGIWNRERWWYGLVKVCRRWRYLMLESASHLHLSLVCTHGTPVADMLAHSPPLSLIIDHFGVNHDITAEDEEGIIFALRQHRDRVRRIRLRKPVLILQKLINALDGEFPILEYLYVMPLQFVRARTVDHNMSLNLPEKFQAPHLHHLLLKSFAIPIEFPFLTTMGMGNLITLSLNMIPPSAYFHPNVFLQRLSLLPQLEILGITFDSYYPSGDIGRELLHTPITTPVTLPNLRWLAFQGASAYLEPLLPWITVPLLEKLQVYFFYQLTYSIPYLQQFMGTAGNIRLTTATLTFGEDCLSVRAYPHKEARMCTLGILLGGRPLDWQVASAAQFFHTLKTVFSAVEDLTLQCRRHSITSEWDDEADRTRWRELLGSFDNVKTLFVQGELFERLSRALQPGKGESPMELLPELQELSYSALASSPDGANLSTPFIDSRKKAGRPVTMIHP